MRIGIFDPYLDDVGGGEKYMLTIAEILSASHDVSVFWDRREDFDAAADRFGLSLKNVTLTANIFNNSTGFFKKIPETTKFDVIIFLSDGSIPFSLSKKLYLHIQRPIDVGKTNVKTRLKMARVSKVFCNSNFTKEHIDRQLGVKSEVIYPPVELNPKKVKRENIILHVGRFRVFDKTVGVGDFKKQSLMIDTFKKMINDGFGGWRFVIAASVKPEDENEFESLKKLANGFPIEFLVNQTNNALWDIYSKAKIYWHASGFGEDLSAHPEFAEHFGISTVEAMGAGAVPVVINAGGQVEIVEDGVNGFLWNNLNELAGKTVMLVEDNKLWEKMSEEARKRASDFSKKSFAHKINDLISK